VAGCPLEEEAEALSRLGPEFASPSFIICSVAWDMWKGRPLGRLTLQAGPLETPLQESSWARNYPLCFGHYSAVNYRTHG
jgi:hypothetical protein